MSESQSVQPPAAPPVAPAAPQTNGLAAGIVATGEWQEEQYIQSLARLENIQSTITALRLTIPLLVRSLTRKHDSPADLYSDFAKQTISSSRSIAELKALWESPELRAILAQVERGVKERGFSIEGVNPGELRDGVKDLSEIMLRYGWQAEAARVATQGSEMEKENEIGKAEALSNQQVATLIEEFAKSHEGTTARFTNDPWVIEVAYKSDDGMNLEFDIVKATRNAKSTYEVRGPKIPAHATNGETKLLKAVERSLIGRQKESDLNATLDVVAAYKNLRSAKCVSCQRIVGPDGMSPAARRLRVVKKDPDGPSTEWVATHEACLPQVT